MATAAFTVALSMSIGLGTLIGSFRRSLDRLDGGADQRRPLRRQGHRGRDPRGVRGAAARAPRRRGPGPLPLRPDPLPRAAGAPPGGGRRGAPAVRALPAGCGGATSTGTRCGAAPWSSPRASRGASASGAGERIVLEGREGPREFAVEAVFYDYTSEHGVILMDRGHLPRSLRRPHASTPSASTSSRGTRSATRRPRRSCAWRRSRASRRSGARTSTAASARSSTRPSP